MKVTNQRQINRLNRLAKTGLVMFDGRDTAFRLTLTEIVFLVKNEDHNDEDGWFVYCENDAYHRRLDECEFFILNRYPQPRRKKKQ